MTEDGENSKSTEHSEEEHNSSWWSKKEQRHFFELAACFVFLAYDFFELWPKNHFWSLLSAVLLLCAFVLVEIPKRYSALISAIIVAIAVTIYFVAPPILPDETEIHGWLLPANAPRLANGCDNKHLPADTLLFLLGSNGYGVTKNGRSRVLTVGSCAIMFVERNDAQLAFDADIFDDNGELIARIEKNEFRLVPGKYAYQTRSADRSTLTVYDKRGKMLLGVRYLNRTTVQVQGAFTCADKTTIAVGESGAVTVNSPAITNGQIAGNCGWNTAGFIITAHGMGF
jgi:hypothetical protein